MNERNGSKSPMHLKSGVCTIKWWAKGERHDKNTTPKIEEMGTLSGGNLQARP